jgi:hypothetical protein
MSRTDPFACQINGDGSADLIYAADANTNIRVLKGKIPYPDLISKVHNGNGAITTSEYR